MVLPLQEENRQLQRELDGLQLRLADVQPVEVPELVAVLQLLATVLVDAAGVGARVCDPVAGGVARRVDGVVYPLWGAGAVRRGGARTRRIRGHCLLRSLKP